MGDAPRWFQLYWSSYDELVDEPRRAGPRRAGCEAIVVTLDTPRARLAAARPRPRATCRSRTGKGIAQYTSDPVFRRLVAERAPPRRPTRAAPRPTPGGGAHAGLD